ncbi:MAG: hypothetical protein Q7S22_00795 [Candidatus Micrarchaeota archaeon]|nr:hypothetical protein [Candidatus Micrarchaeota archaeon]
MHVQTRSTSQPATVNRNREWEKHFGRTYDSQTKYNILGRLLALLDGDKKIGKVVLDAGCGSHSPDYLNVLRLNFDIKLVLLDIAHRKNVFRCTSAIEIKADMEQLGSQTPDIKRKLI